MPWFLWAGAAVLLGLAELHAPGVYLVWIALGAAVTALFVALQELSFEAQIGIFIAASAASSLLGWFVYRGTIRPRTQGSLNERAEQMVGTHGVVAEPIRHGSGKVRIGDTVWLADGPELPESTPVRVRGVRGSRLIVEALDQAGATPGPR